MAENDEGRSAQAADRPTPILVAKHLTKMFPGVRALDDVSFEISPGEIVALLGQNGAGKSTLIQIFAGAHPTGTYDGAIDFRGKQYRPSNVAEAEAVGVALVPQEVNIVPELSVAENISLNDEPTRWGFIDVAERLRYARSALDDFGLDVDPQSRMTTLDLATQQLVVIARALAKNARLLILDEPTAALTADESQRLFERMRSLKRRGVAIIFVSHRLTEVFAISDRIVVMRDGRIRGRHYVRDVTRAEVVAEMVGEAAEGAARRGSHSFDQMALEVRNLTVLDQQERIRVSEVDLSVRRGEVVGLFGLLGAGCMEVALSIFGAWSGKYTGTILINGVPVSIDDPATAVALGLGLIAQDRRDCLSGEQSVSDNIGLASLRSISRRGFLDVAAGRRRAVDLVNQIRIKAPSVDVEVSTLSGGNQQKVQVARWLAARTRVLLMVDPTRGVDVSARREIKQIWSELGRSGHAILLAATDAEELVDACDRVIVLNHGRKAGELFGQQLTEKNLLGMATNG